MHVELKPFRFLPSFDFANNTVDQLQEWSTGGMNILPACSNSRKYLAFARLRPFHQASVQALRLSTYLQLHKVNAIITAGTATLRQFWY